MIQTPIILTLESINLIGHALEMSLIDDRTQELFSKFMPNIKQIYTTKKTDVYEVLIYDANYLKKINPEKTFTKWACVKAVHCKLVTTSMESLTIPKGLYAVFNYKGVAKNFGMFMQSIYTTWQPNSAYIIDNRPHFNVLGGQYKNNQPNSEERVYIPIKLK